MLSKTVTWFDNNRAPVQPWKYYGNQLQRAAGNFIDGTDGVQCPPSKWASLQRNIKHDPSPSIGGVPLSLLRYSDTDAPQLAEGLDRTFEAMLLLSYDDSQETQNLIRRDLDTAFFRRFYSSLQQRSGLTDQVAVGKGGAATVAYVHLSRAEKPDTRQFIAPWGIAPTYGQFSRQQLFFCTQRRRFVIGCTSKELFARWTAIITSLMWPNNNIRQVSTYNFDYDPIRIAVQEAQRRYQLGPSGQLRSQASLQALCHAFARFVDFFPQASDFGSTDITSFVSAVTHSYKVFKGALTRNIEEFFTNNIEALASSYDETKMSELPYRNQIYKIVQHMGTHNWDASTIPEADIALLQSFFKPQEEKQINSSEQRAPLQVFESVAEPNQSFDIDGISLPYEEDLTQPMQIDQTIDMSIVAPIKIGNGASMTPRSQLVANQSSDVVSHDAAYMAMREKADPSQFETSQSVDEEPEQKPAETATPLVAESSEKGVSKTKAKQQKKMRPIQLPPAFEPVPVDETVSTSDKRSSLRSRAKKADDAKSSKTEEFAQPKVTKRQRRE